MSDELVEGYKYLAKDDMTSRVFVIQTIDREKDKIYWYWLDEGPDYLYDVGPISVWPTKNYQMLKENEFNKQLKEILSDGV